MTYGDFYDLVLFEHTALDREYGHKAVAVAAFELYTEFELSRSRGRSTYNITLLLNTLFALSSEEEFADTSLHWIDRLTKSLGA